MKNNNLKNLLGLACTLCVLLFVFIPQSSVQASGPITININAVICDSTSNLPHFGGGAYHTTDVNTASNYIATHPGCYALQGAKFQAGWEAGNPGDNTGASSDSKWTTSLPTNASGFTSIDTRLRIAPEETVWVRAVWNSSYIPFTGQGGSSNSSEMYCDLDGQWYDNYDSLRHLSGAGTYNCVFFTAPSNTPVVNPPNPQTCPVGTQPVVVKSNIYLDSKNSTTAAPVPVNGYLVNPGNYLVKITGGSWSAWSIDNVDTSSLGGGANRTWLNMVSVYTANGNTSFPQSSSSFFATATAAANFGLGQTSLVTVNPAVGNNPNIYIYINDTPITDNRGSMTVELSKCEPVCTNDAYLKCVGNSVYWFNSCDQMQGPYQNCGTRQSCEVNQCVNINCFNDTECGANGNVGGLYCKDGKDGNVFQDSVSNKCNFAGTTASYCSPEVKTTSQAQTCKTLQNCVFGNCVDSNCKAFAKRITDFINIKGYSACGDGKFDYTLDFNEDGKIDAQDVEAASISLLENTKCLQTPVNVCCTDNASQKCGNLNDNKIYQFTSCGVQQPTVFKDCASTNGYVGERTCGTDGNVHQNYQTSTCNAGDTACTTNVTDRIVTNCTGRTTCDETSKTCQPVTCYNSLECTGGNIYTGNTTCQNGNVWQNYLTKTCVNEGKTNSACQDVNTLQQKTPCAGTQDCVSGACVENVCKKLATRITDLINTQNPPGASIVRGQYNSTYNSTFDMNNDGFINAQDAELAIVSTDTAKCTCVQNTEKRCGSDGYIYFYDSCGRQGNKVPPAENCNVSTQFCQSAHCFDNLSADLSAVPTSAKVGDTVVFTVFPHGGTGTYYYTWGAGLENPCQLGTNSSVCITKFNTDGDKHVSVNVLSGTQTVPAPRVIHIDPICTGSYPKCGGDNKIHNYDSCNNDLGIADDCATKNGPVGNQTCGTDNKLHQTYNTYSCTFGQTACTATPSDVATGCGNETLIANSDFCKNGNVFVKYNVPVCNVGQTACNTTTRDELKTPCAGTQDCVSGACVDSVCKQLSTRIKALINTQNPPGASIVRGQYNSTYNSTFDMNNDGFINAQDAELAIVSTDTAKCTCVQNVSKKCVGDEIYYFDSCGKQGNKVPPAENCTPNQTCDPITNTCVCTKNAMQKCGNDGKIYQFDSCGNIQPNDVVSTCSDRNGPVGNQTCGTDNKLHQTYNTYSCTFGQTACTATPSDVQTPCNTGEICDINTNSCRAVTCTTENVLTKCPRETLNGGRYCGGVNNMTVLQNYNTPICLKSGTIDSSCSTNLDARPIETCDAQTQICNAGACRNKLEIAPAFFPADPVTNQLVTFVANASKGSGNYRYNWSEPECSTSSPICAKAYFTSGAKTVSLTVTDNTEILTHTFNFNVANACTGSYPKCNTTDNKIHNYDSCNNDLGVQDNCNDGGRICNTGDATCQAVTCTLSNVAEKCGENQVEGIKTCSLDRTQVLQPFRTWSCLRPGTSNAQCSSSINYNNVIDTCRDGKTCNNGECVCTKNATQKCGNDGKIYQFDSCGNIQPNDVVSTCSDRNGPVGNQTCGTDNKLHQTYNTYSCTFGQTACTATPSDVATGCGNETLIANSDFCKNGNVFVKYNVPVCNVGQTACNTTTRDELKTPCANGCSAGTCIANIPDVNASLSVSPNPANTTQTVIFNVTNVSGGNDIYSYSWTGICSDVGNANTCVKSSLAVGSYPVSATVNSAGKTKTVSTTLVVETACTGSYPKCGGDNKIHNYDSCNHDLGVAADCSTLDSAVLYVCVDGNVRQRYNSGTCTGNQTSCTITPHDTPFQTCDAQTQTCSAGACVNKTVALSVDASANPNPALTGESVEFRATPHGGAGGYTYLWTGACSGTNQTCVKTFNQVGPYTSYVTIYSNGQSANNSVVLNVNTIRCSSDADCGANDYVDQAYCQDGNVWQNYRTWTCQDRGTINSVCSNAVAPRLKTSCTGQTCTGGACVANTQELTASASVSPNPALTGQQVTFTSLVNGGTGTYTYSWSGACSGSAASCSTSFTQIGQQVAILTVTSGTQQLVRTATVQVNAPTSTITAPSVQTNSATNIVLGQATLNGNALSLGGDTTSSTYFQYGTTISYGLETGHQTTNSVGAINQIAYNLIANTTYHFRAVIQNSNSTTYGADMTFLSYQQTQNSVPTVNAGPDLYVSPGQTVILQGSGYDSTGGTLTYFWTCNGGNVYNPNVAQATFNAPNINYGGTYSCTLTGTNSAGFSASDSTLIRINYINNNIVGTVNVQTNPATNLVGTTATLNGYLYGVNNNNYNYGYNNNTYVWFQWGTTTAYGYETNHQSLNYSGAFSQYISGVYSNNVYHFRAVAQDTTGNIVYGQDMTFNSQNYNTGGLLTITKTVRNLTSGNLNLSSFTTAKPGDSLLFTITVQGTIGQNATNVTIRDILPTNLIYNGNLTVDNVTNFGALTSGLNIGNIINGQARVITYQAQVAPSSNFSFGTTTLNNSATVSSNETGMSTPAVATVTVNKAGVLGATSVSTGLTNNFWADSFFLPLLLAGFGLWAYKSGLLGVDQWVYSRTHRTKSFRAEKQLQATISKIREKEVPNEDSGWPTI